MFKKLFGVVAAFVAMVFFLPAEKPETNASPAIQVTPNVATAPSPPTLEASPEMTAKADPVTVGIEQCVYPVTVKLPGGATGEGCAVAVGEDKFFTVYHVIEGGRPMVKNGKGESGWWYAKVDLPRNAIKEDAAILTIPGSKASYLSTRAPKYFEHVNIYGLRTKKKMRGIVSANGVVSLNLNETGVIEGDSGGAVVGDDGCLVGLIRAYEAGDKPNRNVVHFTSIEVFDQPVSAAAPKASTPPSSCPGGNCPLKPQATQPKRFKHKF